MDLAKALRRTNRTMITFDLVLGSATLVAPSATLPVMGHDEPSAETEELFRRCRSGLVDVRRAAPGGGGARAPTRLVGAALAASDRAGHRDRVVALARRSRPGARQALWAGGAANLAMTLGFGRLAARSGESRR